MKSKDCKYKYLHLEGRCKPTPEPDELEWESYLYDVDAGSSCTLLSKSGNQFWFFWEGAAKFLGTYTRMNRKGFIVHRLNGEVASNSVLEELGFEKKLNK